MDAMLASVENLIQHRAVSEPKAIQCWRSCDFVEAAVGE